MTPAAQRFIKAHGDKLAAAERAIVALEALLTKPEAIAASYGVAALRGARAVVTDYRAADAELAAITREMVNENWPCEEVAGDAAAA